MYFVVYNILLCKIKLASHYDFSVLPMSVMGVSNWIEVGEWGELYPVFWEFF